MKSAKQIISEGLKVDQALSFLDSSQRTEVIRILAGNEDYFSCSKTLKAYLSKFKEELKGKGLLHDYYAYWLLSLRQEIVAQERLNTSN